MSEWVTESKRKQIIREVSALFVDIAVVVIICDVITPKPYECILLEEGDKNGSVYRFFSSFFTFDDSNFGVM